MTTQKVQVNKTYHVALGLRWLSMMLEHDKMQGKPQRILYAGDEKTYLTYDEAFREINELKKRGFNVLPPCDNYGSTGACLGHDKSLT